MITPFATRYKVIEAAVREVFENPPYFFEVVLARDFSYEFTLLDNLRTHMSQADGFVAEISEPNPNVMIEFGAAVLGDNQNRPVIALRSNAAQDTPADIKGVLYIDYPSLSNAVIDKGEGITDEEIKKAAQPVAAAIRQRITKGGDTTLKGITDLQNRQICKALTETLLTGLGKLNGDQAKRVLKLYPTVEQFQIPTEDEVARATGVDVAEITFVRHRLGQHAPRKGGSTPVEADTH